MLFGCSVSLGLARCMVAAPCAPCATRLCELRGGAVRAMGQQGFVSYAVVGLACYVVAELWGQSAMTVLCELRIAEVLRGGAPFPFLCLWRDFFAERMANMRFVFACIILRAYVTVSR